MEKQQILVTVVDMTVHTNSVQQWDLFATHVANVTTMLEYVDRSLQKDLRGPGDKDNSKVNTRDTSQSASREKIREIEKDPKLKMLNMLPTLEIEAQVRYRKQYIE